VHSNEEFVEILHVFLNIHPSTTALYPNISASCLFLSVAPIANRNVLTSFIDTVIFWFFRRRGG